MLQRLVQPAGLAKQVTEQIVRVRVIRLQTEGFAIAALGRLQVAGLMLLQAAAYAIDGFGAWFPGCSVASRCGRATGFGCTASSSTIASCSWATP